MGEIRMLCEVGDVKVSWDADKPDEVKNAEEMFKSLKEKGHLFFKVTKKGGLFRRAGKRGDRIRAFSEVKDKGEMISVLDPGSAPLKLEAKPYEKKKKADGEMIKDFDPEAEKIVATPPIGGG